MELDPAVAAPDAGSYRDALSLKLSRLVEGLGERMGGASFKAESEIVLLVRLGDALSLSSESTSSIVEVLVSSASTATDEEASLMWSSSAFSMLHYPNPCPNSLGEAARLGAVWLR